MTAPKAVGVCPGCGLYGSPELFLGEAARRGAVKTALACPSPLAEQLLAYVGLWRPLARGHSWDRVERILAELLPHLQAETVTLDGRTVPAPLSHWQAALDELLVERRPTLDLPLTSHNYLLAMVAGQARKAARTPTPAPTYSAAHAPAAPPVAPAAEPDTAAGLVAELTHFTNLRRIAAGAVRDGLDNILTDLHHRYQALTGRPWEAPQ